MSKLDQINELLTATERIEELIAELRETSNKPQQERLAELKRALADVKEVANSVEWLYFVEDKDKLDPSS